MLTSSITVKAADPKGGLTVGELRGAIAEVPDNSRITIASTWRGRIKSATITWGGVDE